MNPDLSVVMPVFNEVDNVENVLMAFKAYLPSLPFTVELVFVDDGSADGSFEALEQRYCPELNIKLIQLSRNFGSHAALRAGFQHASADCCICYFMDMQEPIDVIGSFYEQLQQGYDLVYEVRDQYTPSFFSKLFTKLLRTFIIKDYPEQGIGCFAFNQKIKQQLNEHVEIHSSLHLQLFTMGFKRVGIPITVKERAIGKSKWTFAKKLKMCADSFFSFSYAPIRLVTIVGTLMALVGGVWAAVIIIIKIFNLIPLQAGWPALIAILMICFGISNLSIGIIAEYLWRTMDAVKNRPAFIINKEVILCHEDASLNKRTKDFLP